MVILRDATNIGHSILTRDLSVIGVIIGLLILTRHISVMVNLSYVMGIFCLAIVRDVVNAAIPYFQEILL